MQGIIIFTDIQDHNVKTFDPLTTTVKTLMSAGDEGTAKGTEVNRAFTQVQGICLLNNTISISVIAAGTVKLVSGLGDTVSLLRTLGSLFDSFGIGVQMLNPVELSLQDAVNNVSHVN